MSVRVRPMGTLHGGIGQSCSSMLSAFACACKMAVGRCGHLLTAGSVDTGLCGQNSLIAFDQRCSKFLVRGPDYLKNSLQFF
jgi:hypothetical protein